MERSRTFKIALGGICLALTIIFLFGGTIVPGIDMTLFMLASLFTAVMILETGVGGGILLYAAALLLGLLLLPNKLAILPYAAFFGWWGILKFYIEKIRTPWAQIALKCAVFAAVLCVGLLGLRELLARSIQIPDYPAALLIIAGILFLLLYDFVFTFLINWYMRRFKGPGEDAMKLS